jgi:hypothetical protein
MRYSIYIIKKKVLSHGFDMDKIYAFYIVSSLIFFLLILMVMKYMV